MFTTTVVDLQGDAPWGNERTSRHYSLMGYAGPLEVAVWLSHYPGKRPLAQVAVTDRTTYRWGTWSVTTTVDPATDTVTWRVPLAVLDDARAQACATCSPLERGTLLTGIRAYASSRVETGVVGGPGPADDAVANRDYTIGDR